MSSHRLRESLALDFSVQATDQSAFPIITIIGNALWLDVLVANCTFKLFKLACSNRIGNGSATASVTE